MPTPTLKKHHQKLGACFFFWLNMPVKQLTLLHKISYNYSCCMLALATCTFFTRQCKEGPGHSERQKDRFFKKASVFFPMAGLPLFGESPYFHRKIQRFQQLLPMTSVWCGHRTSSTAPSCVGDLHKCAAIDMEIPWLDTLKTCFLANLWPNLSVPGGKDTKRSGKQHGFPFKNNDRKTFLRDFSYLFLYDPNNKHWHLISWSV